MNNFKGVVGLALLLATGGCASFPNRESAGPAFPTVPPTHPHARALLANAFRYADPDHGLFDPASGFPVEGWNHDPKQGLHLRAFTQLTAIGEWIELLAVVAAGRADTPQLSRQRAVTELQRVIHALREIQTQPRLSDRGLLVNFLAFMPDHQDGPLAGDTFLSQFTNTFGEAKGQAIWKALASQKWIEPRNEGRDAEIKRGLHYGAGQFKGALTPYDNPADRTAILGLLDQRVVTIIFGDNANLSASIGKAIGMFLHSDVENNPTLAALRTEMDRFLDAQRPGYEHLYDPETGRFFFGWDATRQHWFGWAGQPAHNDYYINEFRGPMLFVILRYGFPSSIPANMGTILKSYRLWDGSDLPITAAWDGSAFQILGLSLMMDELRNPSWRLLLSNAVKGLIDYGNKHTLPGFLSESYTGNGVEYTGRVGIPEMAVTTAERITTSPSLYTLGCAYQVEPDLIEAFLKRHWYEISGQLLTDHGPWEGIDSKTRQPVTFQTSAHTLALMLGLLRTSQDSMHRYLDAKGLLPRLQDWYRPGTNQDLLGSAGTRFAWASKGQLKSTPSPTGFSLAGTDIEQPGLALVAPAGKPFNLSGGKLVMQYQSSRPLTGARIQFKPDHATPPILNQIILDLPATETGAKTSTFILPATPGLNRIQDVVLVWGEPGQQQPVQFTLNALRFEPLQEGITRP